MSSDSFEVLGDELVLVVPPYSAYLRAVRLVAADTAVRAGLDCEETEDFRLAVDELCHTLMSATDHPLHLTFAADADSVTAWGATSARIGSPTSITELSATILESLTDGYELHENEDNVEFKVTCARKRARR